jgi:hypothetical protein
MVYMKKHTFVDKPSGASALQRRRLRRRGRQARHEPERSQHLDLDDDGKASSHLPGGAGGNARGGEGTGQERQRWISAQVRGSRGGEATYLWTPAGSGEVAEPEDWEERVGSARTRPQLR